MVTTKSVDCELDSSRSEKVGGVVVPNPHCPHPFGGNSNRGLAADDDDDDDDDHKGSLDPACHRNLDHCNCDWKTTMRKTMVVLPCVGHDSGFFFSLVMVVVFD